MLLGGYIYRRWREPPLVSEHHRRRRRAFLCCQFHPDLSIFEGRRAQHDVQLHSDQSCSCGVVWRSKGVSSPSSKHHVRPATLNLTTSRLVSFGFVAAFQDAVDSIDDKELQASAPASINAGECVPPSISFSRRLGRHASSCTRRAEPGQLDAIEQLKWDRFHITDPLL